MADELERIVEDLRDELKDLTRVLQSTFKIFDTGNKSESQTQKSVNKQLRQLIENLRKEGKLK